LVTARLAARSEGDIEMETDSSHQGASGLPWERAEGPAVDAGICLSGGGLRAASFAFGVLQVLQERRGLLYGPSSARCLAAVSGGSYIAASYLLGARDWSLRPAEYEAMTPLAEGSPEEAHILSHGQYLAGGRLRIAGFCLLNFLALVVLFVWTGTMLADFASVLALMGVAPSDSRWLGAILGPLSPSYIFVLAAVVVASWFLAVRNLYADGWWRLLPLLSMLVFLAILEPVLQAAAERQNWWTVGRMVEVAAGLSAILFVVAALTLFARRTGVTGLAAHCLNIIALLGARALGLTLLTWSAVWWYRVFAEEGNSPAIVLSLLFASLLGGLLFGYVPNRASLHREYRKRLESCFSVRRGGSAAVTVAGTLLTELAPSREASARFPRLLVCATANVRRDRTSFVPFILSHDQCGVPGLSEVAFPTAKLELIQVPAGFWTWKKEPLVSLFTAVAATGAAVSPSMGRYTLPSLRPLFAAANIRLGRWLPNPFRARVREAVGAMTSPGSGRKIAKSPMGPGYDELIPEMLGLDGPRVYVSDGGHYDNLGLLTLLRAKCAEIWCVDASPEPRGQAEDLHRVLAIARDKLQIEIEIDLDCFAVGADGFYPATHAAGGITYPDGATGRLIVVKLGLRRDSPNLLRQRRRTDRGFPHHSTFWKQTYDRPRMNAYRMLGRDSAVRSLRDCEAR
jgi:hypothetical protein